MGKYNKSTFEEDVAEDLIELYSKKTITFPRYTKETWEMFWGIEHEESWKRISTPDNFDSFFRRYATLMNERECRYYKYANFKTVVVDEEYVKWLNDNEKTHSRGAVREYCDGISDEDAYRLLVKNKMNVSTYITFNPIRVDHLNVEETDISRFNIHFKPEEAKILERDLKSIFTRSQVFVPPYYFTTKGAKQAYKTLAEIADSYFETGTYTNVEEFRYQDVSDFNPRSTALWFPVIIRNKVKSAVNVIDNHFFTKKGFIYDRFPGYVHFVTKKECLEYNETDYYPKKNFYETHKFIYNNIYAGIDDVCKNTNTKVYGLEGLYGLEELPAEDPGKVFGMDLFNAVNETFMGSPAFPRYFTPTPVSNQEPSGKKLNVLV